MNRFAKLSAALLLSAAASAPAWAAPEVYTVDGTQILHDVSLEVHPGEFVGILGPNGSGKSTLLKNIYKVLKPQSGAIELQGKNLLAMSKLFGCSMDHVMGQDTASA